MSGTITTTMSTKHSTATATAIPHKRKNSSRTTATIIYQEKDIFLLRDNPNNHQFSSSPPTGILITDPTTKLQSKTVANVGLPTVLTGSYLSPSLALGMTKKSYNC